MVDKVIRKIIIIGIFLSPIIINIHIANNSIISNHHKTFSSNISLGIILVFFTSIIWFIMVLINKKTIRDLKTNNYIILFLLSIVISLVFTEEYALSIKEIVKYLICFFIFYHILKYYLIEEGFSREIKITLALMVIMNSLIALYQMLIEKSDPFFIRGLLPNNNIYSGFMIAAIPFFDFKFKKIAPVIILIYVIASITILNALALIIYLFYLLAHSIFNPQKLKICIAVILLFLLFQYVSPYSFKRKLLHELSLFEPQNIGEIFKYIQEVNKNHQGSLSSYNKIHLGTVCEKSIYLQNSLFTKLQIDSSSLFSEEYEFYSENTLIKQRYLEWIACINMFAISPIIGKGGGYYQKYLGRYYNGIPKINTMTPNSTNVYLEVLAKYGILVFFSLIMIIYSHLKSCFSPDIFKLDNKESFFALLNITLCSFFISFLNFSLLPLLIVIIALCNKASKK